MPDPHKTRFEDAGARGEAGLMRQLAELIRAHRNYWLIPIVVVLVALGALVVLGSGAAAPFIYTLF